MQLEVGLDFTNKDYKSFNSTGNGLVVYSIWPFWDVSFVNQMNEVRQVIDHKQV